MTERILSCSRCDGDGFVTARRPSGVLRFTVCPKCDGSGRSVRDEDWEEGNAEARAEALAERDRDDTFVPDADAAE